MTDTERTDIHRALLFSGKLEVEIQLADWYGRGVKPKDTLVAVMDLRATVAREVFAAIIDDNDEVEARISAAKEGQPATVAVVMPLEMGIILVREVWPALLAKLLGKDAEAVAILTVLGEDDALLSLAESAMWTPN